MSVNVSAFEVKPTITSCYGASPDPTAIGFLDSFPEVVHFKWSRAGMIRRPVTLSIHLTSSVKRVYLVRASTPRSAIRAQSIPIRPHRETTIPGALCQEGE